METNRLDYPTHALTLVYLAFEVDEYEIELTPEKRYKLGNGFSHLAISVEAPTATRVKHSTQNIL
ncbi:MAG: hypothetical protein ACRCZG_04710 [Culicoidibacterales bacterium]